jgi:class 3 adenylate cyclase/tetratricopeptide (TPR) repeat protein
MDYQPRAIATDDVTLDAGLLELTERLAENAHDVWAEGRIREGWTLGPTRDDQAKQHPCLVPFAELSELEKAYDRRVALETLRAIVTLGYRIEPPAPVGCAPTPTGSTEPTLIEVFADRAGDPATLVAQGRPAAETALGPESHATLARRLLGSGDPLLAYDLADEGLARFPDDPELKRLRSLALARSGDPARARLGLQKLREAGHADEETLGMLARTHKDLGLAKLGRDPAAARLELREALGLYADAHARTGGVWSGINAAALAVILGDENQARAVAARVRELCLPALAREGAVGDDPYWTLATLGEAALILGDLDEATRWYSQAADLARQQRRHGDLSSTSRQARLLVPFRSGSDQRMARCFPTPKVALFTGHRLDDPNRATPRFPAALEGKVREAIDQALERNGARIGYASAACGSDILFLESLLDLGGEVHVVLPYDRDEFVRESVEVLPGAGWAERFRRILDEAEVVTASRQKLAIGGVSYEFANRMAQGLASLKARQIDGELLPMAVWDGQPADSPGGTASNVERWRAQGLATEIIDLNRVAGRVVVEEIGRGEESDRRAPEIPAASEFGSRIVAILFGDVVGFSKLTEEQIPRFVTHFLGLVADRLAALPHASVKANTWGDGLYCVFEDLGEAGRFALDLRDQVVATDWERRGLPAGLNMRIALHAGPVYLCQDPVTERRNCIGTHVSHAARIEPITPPGQVFASQAFAALAAAETRHDFHCHYVGRTPLAKGHGVYPTYHVHPV